MTVEEIPLYFEGSWSILSSIGLVNTIFGSLVVGITGFSPIALVPIIVSIAGAVANGLCYYTLYQQHSTNATLVGGIFADIFWLIQEAGLSFYSYMILNRVLRGSSRGIFLSIFWFIMAIIVGLRTSILVCRARNTVTGNLNLQALVAHLHIGYFVFIAVIEIVSAFFLIRLFTKAKQGSVEISSRVGLFHYLTQSTELRLATLALIGIMRAITYSFQKTLKASDITGQIDRFVFTLECMFPMIMYIDILASRIAKVIQMHPSSSNGHTGSRNIRQQSRVDKNVKMYSMNHTKSKTADFNQTSSSQERIVDRAREENMGVKSSATTIEYDGNRPRDRNREGTISKTVEFEFFESIA